MNFKARRFEDMENIKINMTAWLYTIPKYSMRGAFTSSKLTGMIVLNVKLNN